MVDTAQTGQDGSIPQEVKTSPGFLVTIINKVRRKFKKREKGNLELLAEEELKIYNSKDSDYYDPKLGTSMLVPAIKELIKAFGNQGHSGASAHIVLRHFFYLGNFCKLDGTYLYSKDRRAFCGVFSQKQVMKFIKIINEDKKERERRKK